MKSKRLKPARFINSKVIATISISLVLSLLGLIILLVLLANNLSTSYKESITFEIFLKEGMSDTEILDFQKYLNGEIYTNSTQVITKNEALSLLQEELGENPEELLGYNPLPASIIVTLNADYSNTDSLIMIENRLISFSNNIKEIEYQKELVDLINENIKKMGFVLFSIAILLLIISYALISNTIRLMIYSKRFLIYTMKLVGAKSNFIRAPFIKSNIAGGIVAAIIAMLLITGFMYYMFQDLHVFYEYMGLTNILITAAAILILGLLIPFVSSHLAVNKFLRINRDDLYYI